MKISRTASSSLLRRGMAPAALLGAAALLLTACSGTTSVADTSWGKPDVQGETAISFAADGSAFGSDGCNLVTGTWKEDKGTITFGPLASTMMYCEGVETWLTDATTATMKGDTITLSDKDGKEVGTLQQTDFVGTD